MSGSEPRAVPFRRQRPDPLECTFVFRLTRQQHTRLQRAARRRGCSEADLVREALDAHLTRKEAPA